MGVQGGYGPPVEGKLLPEARRPARYQRAAGRVAQVRRAPEPVLDRLALPLELAGRGDAPLVVDAGVPGAVFVPERRQQQRQGRMRVRHPQAEVHGGLSCHRRRACGRRPKADPGIRTQNLSFTKAVLYR